MTTQRPPRPRYEVAHISEIPHTESDNRYGFQLVGEWKQIRHHFGIREFAANAFVATEAGQEIIHEHFEEPNDDRSQVGDEELYYLVSGSAKMKLNDETFDIGSGTLVFVGDPSVVRSLTAVEAGTTVLTFGTNPGVEFAVSKFEEEMSPPARWS
jgi:hypothetical protein